MFGNVRARSRMLENAQNTSERQISDTYNALEVHLRNLNYNALYGAIVPHIGTHIERTCYFPGSGMNLD
eukprot:1830912-Lingulodinium_polyedra.AAC.1